MIKSFKSCVGEYKSASILTTLCVVVETILEVLIPFMLAKIIDIGIMGSDISYVVKMGSAMLAMAFVALLFGIMSGRFVSKASCGFVKNLRKKMFSNIQDFSFSNIDKFSTSSLITRLTTDATNVQHAYQMILRICFRAPIMLIVATVMAFTINTKLAVIFLVAVPFIVIIMTVIMVKANPNFKAMFKKYDKLNETVQENIVGARIVKAYVREDYENKKFQDASNEIVKYSKRAERWVNFASPAMTLTINACYVAILFFGGKMISVGSFTTGALLSFITYVTQILVSLMMISMVFVMLIMAKASAVRIVEVLKEKPDIVNSPNPVKEVKNGEIVFENVCFAYSNDKKVLEHVDLKIESGQTIGVIGGTGSSKTTFVSLIPRLYEATSGKVLVGGEDVKNIDLVELRENVAMVLQKNQLFSGTVADNLKWGDKDATMQRLEAVAKSAQAYEFVMEKPEGFESRVEQGGTNFSGGQKQRLTIARALAKQPKILILDDSTSAVDMKTDAKIRKALKDDLSGTTKIIIAQRIDSIKDCDRTIVLDAGKVVAFDTHENLLKSCNIYRDVFSSQQKGGEVK